MVAETSELRSGITSAFNKRLNEALQFNPQMGFNIENTVTPSQTIAVLKGEQGTPGLPAAISAVKDDNNLIMLAVSPIERGTLKVGRSATTFSGTGTKTASFIVPAGKKWIYKKSNLGTGGTYTGTSHFVKIIDPTSNYSITLYTAAATSTGVLYVDDEKMYQPIVISEGWEVQASVIVSADTNGAMQFYLMYQELSI